MVTGTVKCYLLYRITKDAHVINGQNLLICKTINSIPENNHKSDAHNVLKVQTLEKKFCGHRHSEIVTEFKESLKMHM